MPVNLVEAIVEFPGDQHVEKGFSWPSQKQQGLLSQQSIIDVPDTRFGRTCAYFMTGDKLGYETLNDCENQYRLLTRPSFRRAKYTVSSVR